MPTWTFLAEWMKPSETVEGGWFTDPQLVVTAFPDDNENQLAVIVDIRFDDDGPYVTGIAVRKHPSAGYRAERTNVAPRDVKRMPLAQYVSAALAFAGAAEKPPTPMERRTPYEVAQRVEVYPHNPRAETDALYRVGASAERPEWLAPVSQTVLDLESIFEPVETPPQGKKPSLDWVAREHKRHTAEGRSPAQEIAATLGVPPNRVHQWFFEARKAGRLEPSPNPRRRDEPRSEE